MADVYVFLYQRPMGEIAASVSGSKRYCEYMKEKMDKLWDNHNFMLCDKSRSLGIYKIECKEEI